jgi:hypothetical protein
MLLNFLSNSISPLNSVFCTNAFGIRSLLKDFGESTFDLIVEDFGEKSPESTLLAVGLFLLIFGEKVQCSL